MNNLTSHRLYNMSNDDNRMQQQPHHPYNNLPNEMLKEISKTMSKQNKVRYSQVSKAHERALRPTLRQSRTDYHHTKFGTLWKTIAERKKMYEYFDTTRQVPSLAEVVWEYFDDTDEPIVYQNGTSWHFFGKHLTRTELREADHDFVRTLVGFKYFKRLFGPFSTHSVHGHHLHATTMFQEHPEIKQKFKEFLVKDKYALLAIIRFWYVEEGPGISDVYEGIQPGNTNEMRLANFVQNRVLKERTKRQQIKNLQSEIETLVQEKLDRFKQTLPSGFSNAVLYNPRHVTTFTKNWNGNIQKLKRNLNVLKKTR